MNKPRHGFSTECTLDRVVDGDTLCVEIKRKFNVRLIHENEEGKQFNCAELKTPEGKAAKEFVEELLQDNPNITIFIPAGEDAKLMDINSFNRILSEVWVGNYKLTDILLKEGYGELK